MGGATSTRSKSESARPRQRRRACHPRRGRGRYFARRRYSVAARDQSDRRLKGENDDQRHGIEIVRKTLSWPARQIVIDVGEDGSIVVGKSWTMTAIPMASTPRPASSAICPTEPSIQPRLFARLCREQHQSRDCCSPPKRWSPKNRVRTCIQKGMHTAARRRHRLLSRPDPLSECCHDRLTDDCGGHGKHLMPRCLIWRRLYRLRRPRRRGLTRRQLFWAGAAGFATAAVVPPASATMWWCHRADRPPDWKDTDQVGSPSPRHAADFPNGYAVPLSLDIDCPMTESDHVRCRRRRLAIRSSKSPPFISSRSAANPRLSTGFASRAAICPGFCRAI